MGLILESGSTELLIGLLGLLSLIYCTFTAKFNFWKQRGVPYVEPTPFFGNLRSMTLFQRSPAENFMDLYNSPEAKDARFLGAWATRNPILVAIDPDFIKEVLIKDFQFFSDRGLAFNDKKEPLTAHLFNLGGWRWRALRTRLSPTFTSGKMKNMFGTMVDCTPGLIRLMKASADKGEVVEIKEPLAQFTTDIIGSCAFGLQFNSMENTNSEFRQMGRAIFEPTKWGMIKRTFVSAFPAILKYINISIIDPKISEFFISAVKDTVKHREDNPNFQRNDMMQLLVDLKKAGPIVDDEKKYTTNEYFAPTDDQGRQVLEMTDELLAAQAFVFFLAGFETSSTTMSFALYELARHQDIQDKLAREVREINAKNDGKLTYESIHEMKYLDMVISETLRRYPPVGNLFRKTTKPYKVSDSDLILPAGMRVFIPAYAIHNDPKYYPNPDKFDPERFSPEQKQSRHPMVYLPFGEGPRNCIGERFGLLQSKIGLASVVSKFRVEICDKTIVPPVLDPRAFVTTLQGGINLKISNRT